MKIGLIGGSFDPIHHGHLLIAEQVREKYHLDYVYFMPARIPPHKQDKKLIPSEDRYKMIELAIKDNPHFIISDLELARKEVSYTINTVTELKRLHNDAKLYFIAGADTIFNLETWLTIDKLLKEVVFVGAVRPGYNTDKLKEKATELSEKFGGDVRIAEISELSISSTEIRRRIKNNESIKYIVPDEVIDYIYEKGLYK